MKRSSRLQLHSVGTCLRASWSTLLDSIPALLGAYGLVGVVGIAGVAVPVMPSHGPSLSPSTDQSASRSTETKNDAPDESRQLDRLYLEAAESISAAEIRRHVEVLADDRMEGRETGTAGFQRAAAYVAGEFEALPLAPMGDDGTYLQEIEFFETTLEPDSVSLELQSGERKIEMVFTEDYVRYGGFGKARESISADLVFVGYGITAPEYDHDDYGGAEVDGKIVVVLSGAPPSFDTDQRAYYSSGTVKRRRAADLGAVGMLTVRTPIDQERSPWERYVSGIGKSSMRWLQEERPYEGFPELAGSATLSESGAAKLFELAGRDLAALFESHEAGGTGSFELGVSADLSRTSNQGRSRSANVVGLLKGSDPVLQGEYLLVTAHLDHLGLRPGKDGDEIHNGAYDNAVGVASVLEIARAMRAVSPKRSVIFVALTAEEKGLQGSSYLAHNPPVPIDQIVANLNIDMPYLGYPIGDVEGFGVEHSSLQADVARAAEAIGIELSPDSMPERVRFVRSDQFSFVQQGIPGMNLKPGSKSTDPSFNGEAMLLEFLSTHYHRPSDDLDLAFSDVGAERFVRVALLTGLFVAQADERPRWNEGDFFGELFAQESSTQADADSARNER